MYSVIYTTAADEEDAVEIIRHLLEKRLIACANIFNIRSLYRWNDELRQDDEVGVILKTTKDKVKDLSNEVERIHPYEVPCVLALDIDTGSKPFLQWIQDETS